MKAVHGKFLRNFPTVSYNGFLIIFFSLELMSMFDLPTLFLLSSWRAEVRLLSCDGILISTRKGYLLNFASFPMKLCKRAL